MKIHLKKKSKYIFLQIQTCFLKDRIHCFFVSIWLFSSNILQVVPFYFTSILFETFKHLCTVCGYSVCLSSLYFFVWHVVLVLTVFFCFLFKFTGFKKQSKSHSCDVFMHLDNQVLIQEIIYVQQKLLTYCFYFISSDKM